MRIATASQGCQRLFLLGPRCGTRTVFGAALAQKSTHVTPARHMRNWTPLSPARLVYSNTHMPSTVAIMSYYCLCLDAQQLAPVTVSCWRHCLALQKPPLAPRNSYWCCFRRHSARLTPVGQRIGHRREARAGGRVVELRRGIVSA